MKLFKTEEDVMEMIETTISFNAKTEKEAYKLRDAYNSGDDKLAIHELIKIIP